MTEEEINTQRIVQAVKNNLRSTLSQTIANSSTGAIQYATCAILDNMCKQGIINGYNVEVDHAKCEISMTIKPIMPINNIITTFDLMTDGISFEVAAVISNENDDQWQK